MPAASGGAALDDDALVDLGLDRVLAELHCDPAPARAFRVPLPDAAAVRYRQDVFRDLEDDGVRRAVEDLAGAVRRAAAFRDAAGRIRQDALRHRLHLGAALAYVAALDAAGDALAGARSTALTDLHAHVRRLAGSPGIGDLRTRAAELDEAWRALRFAVQVQSGRVVVAPFDDEPDLIDEVHAAFARFGAPPPPAPPARGTGLLGSDLGSVHGWILDAVAQQRPELFARLAALAADHPDPVDPALERFASDLGFYTAWRALCRTAGAAGAPMTLPEVHEGREVDLTDAVDLALALRLVAERRRPVGNDLALGADERVLVISGPNQGGKSTAARALGQLLHLASVGVPVAAARARVPLVDRVLTLFPREERLRELEGGLGEEVRRVHDLLEAATGRSLLVLNEVFASTTAPDALVLLEEVLRRIDERGSLAVCVTFLDEVARRGGGTVSAVAEVDPDDPAVRTFTLTRREADGRAWARTVAERHGLTAGGVATLLGTARR